MCRKVYHTQQGNVRRGRLYFTLLTSDKTQGIGLNIEDLHAGARARAAAGEAALCGLPVSHDLHTCQRDQPGFDSDVNFSRRALLEVCAKYVDWVIRTGSGANRVNSCVGRVACSGLTVHLPMAFSCLSCLGVRPFIEATTITHISGSKYIPSYRLRAERRDLICSLQVSVGCSRSAASRATRLNLFASGIRRLQPFGCEQSDET